MAKPQESPDCPFSVATLQLARSLVRLHQRMRGELVKAQSGSTVIVPAGPARAALGHIAILVSFLGYELDPGRLRPIRTEPRLDWPGSLPVPTLQTARSLIRLHQRLRGEIAKQKAGETLLVEIKRAKRTMIAIEALMPILGVDFDASLLRVVLNRKRTGPLGHGYLRSGILAALRVRGSAMTYQELADALLAKQHKTLTPDRYRHFLQKTREAVYNLKIRGRVQPELLTGLRDGISRQRWRLRSRLSSR
jgi:hypothetical protein